MIRFSLRTRWKPGVYHHDTRRNNSQANRDARDRENASRVREVPGPRFRAAGRVVHRQGTGRGTVEQSRTDARDGAAFGLVKEIGVGMRQEPNMRAEVYRTVHPQLGPSASGANWGYFEMKTTAGTVRIISSGTDPEWEHVSVSLADRCPSWSEMQAVKELFWDDSEVVLQFHPTKAEYVNCHPYCLHMWRHKQTNHALPPRRLIGL